MVCRRMAVRAEGQEVPHPVGMVPLPVACVVHPQDLPLPSAEAAGVAVPVEDGGTERFLPVPGPALVPGPFGDRGALFYRFKRPGVEGPGLDRDGCERADRPEHGREPNVQVLLVPDCRGEPSFRPAPVVEAAPAVSLPAPPPAAVPAPFVMPLLFVLQRVELRVCVLVFLRLYGDPDMLVPGVDTHLHRLHAEGLRVQEPDRERAAADDLRPALFQEPAYLFDVEGRHARPSVSVNCKDGHRAYLLPVTVAFKKWLTPSAASDNTRSVSSFTCGSCPARGGSTTPMLSGSFISAAHFP